MQTILIPMYIFKGNLEANRRGTLCTYPSLRVPTGRKLPWSIQHFDIIDECQQKKRGTIKESERSLLMNLAPRQCGYCGQGGIKEVLIVNAQINVPVEMGIHPVMICVAQSYSAMMGGGVVVPKDMGGHQEGTYTVER